MILLWPLCKLFSLSIYTFYNLHRAQYISSQVVFLAVSMALIHFFLIFSMLSLAFARNHVARPGEIHWKSVFPDTPMPQALKDLLPPTDSSKKFKKVNSPISPFIIYENADSRKESKYINSPISPFIIYKKPDSTKKSKIVNSPISPFIIYENADSSKMSKGVNSPISPFIIYENADSSKESKGNKNSLTDNPENAKLNETICFFEEDLQPGKMVNLPLLTKARDTATFLPDRVSKSIPFSSDKFPEILKHFSFEAESSEANAMKQTIKGCERKVMNGEVMYCATSFESFVDLSVSKLGKNIQLLSNELGKNTKNPVFEICKGIQKMGDQELICHKIGYPYAVFLCHSIDKTVVYKVPLVGIDGTKANALAICHKDTSAWNPNHPAFLFLNIKPGTIPICHFVARDTLIWVSD